MSKMSQLHADLSVQAYELGFDNIEDAEANGYVIDYLQGKLVKQDEQDEQEQAHQAWLKEREEVLEGLNKMWVGAVHGGYEHETLEKAIEFIKKGEC